MQAWRPALSHTRKTNASQLVAFVVPEVVLPGDVVFGFAGRLSDPNDGALIFGAGFGVAAGFGVMAPLHEFVRGFLGRLSAEVVATRAEREGMMH